MNIIELAVEALDRAIPLCILYEGKPKTIEVHAVGLSVKDNAPVIRGFQIDGEASRPLPCWALLRVDKIEEAGFGTPTSDAPRPGYVQGDKQMSKIIREIVL
ncbi:hypothetical protein [Sphingopyxis flava]|uniref:WYL domain-containing protein n=1 Tax=Sphingopyxis flava TaxID=1507287 RepID=A0A1T5CU55_9SPHN|nr:hypothetical protein [Sphingopyxis flava]SKB62934.1 hypothetical protein SAMN06295937_1011116 [Sphingopyxis flava]